MKKRLEISTKFTMKTMKNLKGIVSLVAVFALAVLLIANVSAFASISSVEVAGVQGLNAGTSIATFAGDTLPVRIIFTASTNATDVRVKVAVIGDKDYVVSSDRFDVVAGQTYSNLISITMPTDIDPSEIFRMEVSVEDQELGVGDRRTVNLTTHRESYEVEVLDVAMDNRVNAGDNLALDIVLKNRGRHFAEDTFVVAKIPALGIERKAYFGDLSSVDQADPDKEDAAERRLYLNIPSNAPAGVYTVELEAYNADSSTTVTRKVAVVAGDNSMVVSSVNSKTFAADEKGTYSLTLVNSGNKIKVYNLVFETPSGLSLDSDDSVVAIPAGTSKTVTVDASASKPGKYNFAVNVYSDNELVKKEAFTANVEGSKINAGNTTVVLTVVLAIIFVVLLVVLIVLLTRKPEKTEEFGESYY